jgi:hypothetical protein
MKNDDVRNYKIILGKYKRISTTTLIKNKKANEEQVQGGV